MTTVAEQTRPHGPMVRHGQYVATCGRCMDHGIVSVLTPETLKRLWADSRERSLALFTCVVCCDCEHGRDLAQRMRLPVFESRHALISYDSVIRESANPPPGLSHAQHAWNVAREMLTHHHDMMQPKKWKDLE